MKKLGLVFLSFCFAAMAQQRLPDGPGKETLKRVCAGCHSPENVAGFGKSREDWGALVGEMANFGAEGTVDEFNEIVDYLTKYFPKTDKVNVNKAAAKEIQKQLEFSQKEAESIVHYREENGDFKAIDDLKKVPGLDAKKVDAKKDKLAF